MTPTGRDVFAKDGSAMELSIAETGGTRETLPPGDAWDSLSVFAVTTPVYLDALRDGDGDGEDHNDEIYSPSA